MSSGGTHAGPAPSLERKASGERKIVYEFTPEEVKYIDALKAKLPPQMVRPDDYLLRFLRARNFDVPAAYEMLKAEQHWRRTHQVDSILSRPPPANMQLLQECVPQCWHGFSREGHPVLYYKIGPMHLSEFLKIEKECVEECHIWFQEEGMRLCRESSERLGRPVNQMITVIDLKGVSLAHRKTLKYLKGTEHVDKNYYPETLNRMVMINAPRIAPVLWKLVRPMLDSRTQAKVTILGSDYHKVLNQLIAPDQMPHEYGGSCPLHAKDDCVPEVPLQTVKENMTKYAYAHKVANKMVEATVAARGVHTAHLEVKGAKETELFYTFSTAKHDIQFAVEYFPGETLASLVAKDKEPAKTEKKGTVLLGMSKIASSPDVPHEGNVTVRGPGVARFIWDNTYSRFTGKTVYYELAVGAGSGHSSESDESTAVPSVTESHKAFDEDHTQKSLAPFPLVDGVEGLHL